MQVQCALECVSFWPAKVEYFRNVTRMVGSTACAITNVACGRGDGYFGAGFHIWDIAAAGLILKEAGGFTFNMKGRTKNLKHNLIKN